MCIVWLIILFFVPFPLCGVITGGSQWELNGKTIVLLGDTHLRTLHDKAQKEIIENALGNKIFNNPAHIFIEDLPLNRHSLVDFYRFNSAEDENKLDDNKNMQKYANISFLNERYRQILPEDINKFQTLFKKFIKTMINYPTNLEKIIFLAIFNESSIKGYFQVSDSLMFDLLKNKHLDPRYERIDVRNTLDAVINKVYKILEKRIQNKLDEKKFVTIIKSLNLEAINLLQNIENKFNFMLSEFTQEKYLEIYNFYEKMIQKIINFKQKIKNFNITSHNQIPDLWEENKDDFWKEIIDAYFLYKIIDAIFNTKKQIIIGIFGLHHVKILEKKLELFKAVKKADFYIPQKNFSDEKDLLLHTYNILTQDRMPTNSLLRTNYNIFGNVSPVLENYSIKYFHEKFQLKTLDKFIKDAKERFKVGKGHYYFKEEEIGTIPLTTTQMELLLTINK